MVIRRDSGLSARDLERFRISLEQERRHQVDLIERLQREGPPAQEQAAYAKLARVNEALRRQIDGGFGLCEECGRPIGQDRLEDCPTCVLCVDCHERAEAG